MMQLSGEQVLYKLLEKSEQVRRTALGKMLSKSVHASIQSFYSSFLTA